MRVVWEEDDIKPMVQYSRPGLSEKWTIGYVVTAEGPNRYVSISDRDAMVTGSLSKADLAGLLTKEGYLPVELVELLDSKK